MREDGRRKRLREGDNCDLNADCDGAMSRQLLTITLMEELRCKRRDGATNKPTQFVSVCPPLIICFTLFLFSSFCESRRVVETEMDQPAN